MRKYGKYTKSSYFSVCPILVASMLEFIPARPLESFYVFPLVKKKRGRKGGLKTTLLKQYLLHQRKDKDGLGSRQYACTVYLTFAGRGKKKKGGKGIFHFPSKGVKCGHKCMCNNGLNASVVSTYRRSMF